MNLLYLRNGETPLTILCTHNIRLLTKMEDNELNTGATHSRQ